eukprot:7253435-Pyramimonas_sp.AAC.1
MSGGEARTNNNGNIKRHEGPPERPPTGPSSQKRPQEVTELLPKCTLQASWARWISTATVR